MGQQCQNVKIAEEVENIIEHQHQILTLPSEALREIQALRQKNSSYIQRHKVWNQSEDGSEQYLGYMRNGKKEGYGELRLKSHSKQRPHVSSQQSIFYETEPVQRYFGYFHNDKPHIRGVLVFSYKHYYIGQFRDGEMHGFGKQVTENYQFTGEYCDGRKKYGLMIVQQERQSVATEKQRENQSSSSQRKSPDPETEGKFSYEGSFNLQNGKFDGYGQIIFPSVEQENSTRKSESYKGEFWNGSFHGKGQYFCQDFMIYEGNFRQNQYHGQGVYRWKDGSYFEGQYQYGAKHGQGKYVSSTPLSELKSSGRSSTKNTDLSSIRQSQSNQNIVLGIWENGNIVSKLKPIVLENQDESIH